MNKVCLQRITNRYKNQKSSMKSSLIYAIAIFFLTLHSWGSPVSLSGQNIIPAAATYRRPRQIRDARPGGDQTLDDEDKKENQRANKEIARLQGALVRLERERVEAENQTNAAREAVLSAYDRHGVTENVTDEQIDKMIKIHTYWARRKGLLQAEISVKDKQVQNVEFLRDQILTRSGVAKRKAPL